jgi:hypothetical protein
VFADVIPWALARYEATSSVDVTDTDDVEADLLAVGRLTLARVVRPENVRLKRIAVAESERFPEFALSADPMMWTERKRAVAELLRRHHEAGRIVCDDHDMAAEHFLALVEAVPARMADFGVVRPEPQRERDLRSAVSVFLRGLLPR